MDAAAPRRSAALVTASYAPDFERCRLLCETVDRHVTGLDRHYLLVAGHDVARFRALESAGRVVVDERDLLPGWIRPVRDPTSLFRRYVWLSLRTPPLRGWHVQQLRRMALAAFAGEETLVFVDSDVVFVRPFDLGQFWQGDRLRLLRRDGGLSRMAPGDHQVWSAQAARILGIVPPEPSPHDYIGTLIAWRRDTLVALCAHVEAVTGRPWPAAVASGRRFSECTIYGRYVDDVRAGAGHVPDSREFCRVYWNGPVPGDGDIAAYIDGLEPWQVAIGLQSFIGVDAGRLRGLLGL